MLRGWLPFYATSVQLGVRHLIRHGYLREAVIRVVVPLDPSRYLELPAVRRELAARPGDRVLDLASPKLLAVVLAREGVEVVSVDALPAEVERWRRLAEGESNVRFQTGDGRALPFADATFDHAYSVSVLEHIPDGGDEAALRELARVVTPRGRVVLTLPHSPSSWEEWRERPLYGQGEARAGRYFFQRWYDGEDVRRLLAAAPTLTLRRSQIVSLTPNWNASYTRLFPWLIPLGPFFGLIAREREGPRGDVIRLTLDRTGPPGGPDSSR